MTFAVARILDEQGVPKGAGGLFRYDQVLTNAHVVNVALGRALLDTRRPTSSEKVNLDFPFGQEDRPYEARVVRWAPPKVSKRKPASYRENDIATLQLIASPPSDIPPAKLHIGRQKLLGTRVAAYGFPVDEEGGVWAYGELQDNVSCGRVQLVGEGIGNFITEGFSGAPVFSEDKSVVYGIVAMADAAKRTAYVIPPNHLIERLEFTQPEKGTKSWKVNFFRLQALTALLNDLEELEDTGMPTRDDCAVVRTSLGKISDTFSDFEDLAHWESPLHKDIERLQDIYIDWNNCQSGLAGASDRRILKAKLRDERQRLSDKIRALRGLLYQEDIYSEGDDDMFDGVFAILGQIAEKNPSIFRSVEGVVRKYQDTKHRLDGAA